MLRVLSDLVARRGVGKSPNPSKVYFAWVARHAVEFCVMDQAVAAASMDSTGWLSTSLWYTGKEALDAPGATKLDTLDKVSSRGSESGSSAAGAPGQRAGAPRLRFRYASPFWWNTARRMQPQITGPLHLMIVICLVFTSGFFGHALAYTWYGEASTYYQSSGETFPYESLYWRFAIVDFVCTFVMGLGFPFLVSVFLPHLYR